MVYLLDNTEFSLLEEHFEEISKFSKPRIISLRDAIDKNLVPDMTPSVHYAKHLIEHIDLEPLTEEEFHKTGGEMPQNHIYGAVKIMYLVHCMRTVGFYSYPQAFLHDSGDWKVHPGHSRVKVTLHTDSFDQKFVFWDDKDIFDTPVLSFDEWWSIFKDVPRNKWWVKQEKLVELHCGEDRPEYFEWILRVYEMYDRKLPYFHGEVPQKLKRYFSTDPSVPVHVKAEELKDEYMKHFLDFNPDNKEFKNEYIHIYINQ
jgi:hypothetical protein